MTIVTGDRGAFVADTLTADLTFYENGQVPTAWDAVARFRGVAEGDMTRYAIPSRSRWCPSIARSATRSWAWGTPGSSPWREGLATVRVAEACLQSAREGRTAAGRMEPREDRCHRSRQDRPAARRPVRLARARCRRCRRQCRRPSTSSTRGQEPFPGEAELAGAPRRVGRPSGRLLATTDYADAIPSADVVVVVVPLVVDDVDAPDFSLLDSATTSIGSPPDRRDPRSLRDDAPVGTTRDRWRPMLEQESGLRRGCRLPPRLLAGASADRACLRGSPQVPQAHRRSRRRGRRPATAFYDAVLEFDERPDLPRPNGVWDLGTAEAAELAKLAETTYRDVNIALANQFALFAEKAGIDVYRVIEAANSQPYSHLHQPGRLRRWALHPCLPPALPVRRSRRHRRPRGPRGECRDAGTRRGAARRRLRRPARRKRGRARRRLSRRGEGDRVLGRLPPHREPEWAGRGAVRPRPVVLKGRVGSPRLVPYGLGNRSTPASSIRPMPRTGRSHPRTCRCQGSGRRAEHFRPLDGGAPVHHVLGRGVHAVDNRGHRLNPRGES